MEDGALQKLIAEKEAESASAEEAFKAGVDELQKTYERLQQEKEEALEAIKESGLGLMKAVEKAKAKKEAAVSSRPPHISIYPSLHINA